MLGKLNHYGGHDLATISVNNLIIILSNNNTKPIRNM